MSPSPHPQGKPRDWHPYAHPRGSAGTFLGEWNLTLPEPDMPHLPVMSGPFPNSHPKVFISYSHDSSDHCKGVLGLAQRLRLDGFDTMIDQFVEGTPPQGWPRWMLNQIDWAEFVLLVCTPTYYQRFRGLAPGGPGRGVDWEGSTITNELYGSKSVSTRFVPVFLGPANLDWVPEPVRGASVFPLTSEEDYMRLGRQLARVAGTPKAELGPPPALPRITAAPLVFPEARAAAVATAAPSSLVVPDLSDRPAPGGMMAVEDAFYIERGADQLAKIAAKRRRETVVIKGPRQFGSSSLMARYLSLCKASGKTTAYVDFSRFEESVLADYGRLLTTLASLLARKLAVAWPASELRTQADFLQLMESTLLPAVRGNMVLGFDETDRVLRHPFGQDFFSMVRNWQAEGADPESPWHRVGLALASSSEPKLFITDPLRSPFNVGDRLTLNPFSLAEVTELNRRYGAPLTDAECAELRRLLGGHPYLTQEAFYKLSGPQPIPFGQLCMEAASDGGPFADHLRAMLSNVQKAPGLLAAFKQIIQRGTVAENSCFYRLEGAGLVRREGQRIAVVSQIYTDYFSNA